MLILQVFIYLQVLDFLTTLVGFKLGASEASPFIAKLIHLVFARDWGGGFQTGGAGNCRCLRGNQPD